MRPFILTAVALTIVATFLVSRLWNPVELGPDLANPKAFFGCYGSQAEKVTVNGTDVAVPSQGQNTKIKRYLMLKRDAVVHTVNNLRLDASGKGLSVGNADTGFFTSLIAIRSLRQLSFQMTAVLRGCFREFAAERLLTTISACKRTDCYPPIPAIPDAKNQKFCITNGARCLPAHV